MEATQQRSRQLHRCCSYRRLAFVIGFVVVGCVLHAVACLLHAPNTSLSASAQVLRPSQTPHPRRRYRGEHACSIRAQASSAAVVSYGVCTSEARVFEGVTFAGVVERVEHTGTCSRLQQPRDLRVSLGNQLRDGLVSASLRTGKVQPTTVVSANTTQTRASRTPNDCTRDGSANHCDQSSGFLSLTSTMQSTGMAAFACQNTTGRDGYAHTRMRACRRVQPPRR